MGWGLSGILRLLPSPTLVIVDHIRQTLEHLPPEAAILDVGAGGRRITPKVTTFDACAGPEVDIVGDIHDIPLADNSYDCVFCTGTLEHVTDPWRAIREIYRVTRPGGIVHVDVPFIQGFHADPNDYWRFTVDGLRLLCKPFVELESGVHIGPTCGMVWVMREWANSISNGYIASNLMLVAMAILTAPCKYLDYIWLRSPRSHRVASAVYFRGRKPFEMHERTSGNSN